MKSWRQDLAGTNMKAILAWILLGKNRANKQSFLLQWQIFRWRMAIKFLKLNFSVEMRPRQKMENIMKFNKPSSIISSRDWKQRWRSIYIISEMETITPSERARNISSHTSAHPLNSQEYFLPRHLDCLGQASSLWHFFFCSYFYLCRVF